MEDRRSKLPVLRATILEVVALALLWMAFSGKFDAIHLGYGVLSIAITVGLTRHLILYRDRPEQNRFLTHLHWGRALAYPFWLFVQIFLANFHVAKVVLSPKLKVDPFLMRVPFPRQTDMARAVLGNSITLTPGTITLRVEPDGLLVHALDHKSAADLFDGSMASKVAELFGDPLPEGLVAYEVAGDHVGEA